MGENTKIEWATHTFNPWFGCQKVSPGCDNCYAEALMDKRLGRVQWGPHGERVRTSTANWNLPLKWAMAARGARERPRVFCASLADVFDNQVSDEWRSDLFALIENTPELDWLLLTKRPENVRAMLPAWWQPPLSAPMWLGVTAEDQHNFDRRWAILRMVWARVRFVSYEPALGPLLIDHLEDDAYPDWIICGGESGPNARPMNPAWARDLRDQCAANGVPFLFKQWGEWAPFYYRDDGEPRRSHEFGDVRVHRIGKLNAGRLLDGAEHNAFPTWEER